MILEQINIYDLIGGIKDPVYEMVASLKKGQSVEVEDMQLSLNQHGLYEISNEELHESFIDVRDCYRFICRQESKG